MSKPLKGLEKLLDCVARSGADDDRWQVTFTLHGGNKPLVSMFHAVRDDEGPEPCPLHVGQDNGCTEPAAPEPSADHVPGRSIMQRVTQAEARADSAEAQLAAVRRFERRIRDDEYLVVDDNGERLLADVLLSLLTPAPSPGADPGRSGK